MRISVMGVELANGSFGAMASESVVPLIEAARVVRDTGLFDGKPARGGIVRSDKGIVMQFRVAVPPAESKPAKGKAK